jgi:hypothetical protein
MSLSNNRYFVGVGVRSRDAALVIDVRAQCDASGIHDVSGHSHSLFPPNGEVELRGVSAASMSSGEWVAFRATSEGPPGRSRYRAFDCRRLMPFEDLSHLGSSENARRLLVEDGRPHDVPGDRLVRVGEREMVKVRFAKSSDGYWRVVPSLDMTRLPVWEFDDSRLLTVPAESGQLVLMDPRDGLRQIGNLDWSSDADFVRRIAESLDRVDEGRDRALRQFATALRAYADDLERGPRRTVDPTVAQEDSAHPAPRRRLGISAGRPRRIFRGSPQRSGGEVTRRAPNGRIGGANGRVAAPGLVGEAQ